MRAHNNWQVSTCIRRMINNAAHRQRWLSTDHAGGGTWSAAASLDWQCCWSMANSMNARENSKTMVYCKLCPQHPLHEGLIQSWCLQCFDSVGQQEGHPACKKLSVGMLVDLYMAQLMPLPLNVSCSSISRLVLPSWFYHSGASSPR